MSEQEEFDNHLAAWVNLVETYMMPEASATFITHFNGRKWTIEVSTINQETNNNAE